MSKSSWFSKPLIKRRVWVYKDWVGKPIYLGSDEYLRRTLLLGTGFGWAIVFALWECKCQECSEIRVQDPIYRRWMQYRQNTRYL